MPAPFTGGCRCGAIRYEASAEPIFFGHCHCRDCQYASGGAFSSILAVPVDAFKLTKGAYKKYTVVADSGDEVIRMFCPDCGTPLFSEIQNPPGMWIIKAGSLDDPSWLTPTVNIWCDSAQPWASGIGDLPNFAKEPSG